MTAPASAAATAVPPLKLSGLEPAVIGEDREMLEDLIAAAFNDAVKKVEQRSAEKMSGLMSGLQLPPGMKLPF